MDWGCCASNRARTETMGETFSWFYIGSGDNVTVGSMLTLIYLIGPNYKWYISLD